MSLFKKANELETRKTIRVLLYGEAGIGKTTFACSAPNAVLFDFDGGVQRINLKHRVPTLQVHSWDEVAPALDEVRNTPSIESIVVDTAGKMLDFMDVAIIKSDSRLGKRDGSLTMQGYGVRKRMFIDFLKQVSMMGKNVIFVAHEREEKQGEVVKKRPEIGGSSAGDLIKEMDLVGYMQAIGKDRTITFDPNECYYAKNTCNLPERIKLPIVVDANGNAIGANNELGQIIKQYQERQAADNEAIGKYDELVARLTTQIGNVNNADEANMFAELMRDMDANNEHLFDSKAVARRLFSERVTALGLTYNKDTKCYE